MGHRDEIAKKGKPIKGGAVARRELAIPLYTEEGTVFRLSVNVIEGTSETHGIEFDVSCGAGVGSDHVTLRWKRGSKEQQAVFYLRDVLKAWVATIDPEAPELPSVKVELIDSEEVV